MAFFRNAIAELIAAFPPPSRVLFTPSLLSEVIFSLELGLLRSKPRSARDYPVDVRHLWTLGLCSAMLGGLIAPDVCAGSNPASMSSAGAAECSSAAHATPP